MVRSIRAGRVEDIPSVLNLWREAGATPSVTDTVEDLQRALLHPSTLVLLAVTEDRVIGTVIGAFDGWRGNMYRLVVHPSYRRLGIAQALVREAERILAARGVRRITALVEKDHELAVRFWSAAGYDVDSRMVRFVASVPR